MEQIAAIVVTYNRKDLLYQCVEKLLAQQNVTCDILIVDNASTDGTGAEFLTLAEHQPHLFLQKYRSKPWRRWRLQLWCALGRRGGL